MADPFSWAAIITTVVSSAAGAATAIAQGEAAEDAAKYNAAVAQNDAAAMAEQSQYEASRIRDRNRRILASQRAGQGKSGLAMSVSFLVSAREKPVCVRGLGKIEISLNGKTCGFTSMSSP